MISREQVLAQGRRKRLVVLFCVVITLTLVYKVPIYLFLILGGTFVLHFYFKKSSTVILRAHCLLTYLQRVQQYRTREEPGQRIYICIYIPSAYVFLPLYKPKSQNTSRKKKKEKKKEKKKNQYSVHPRHIYDIVPEVR